MLTLANEHDLPTFVVSLGDDNIYLPSIPRAKMDALDNSMTIPSCILVCRTHGQTYSFLSLINIDKSKPTCLDELDLSTS